MSRQTTHTRALFNLHRSCGLPCRASIRKGAITYTDGAGSLFHALLQTGAPCLYTGRHASARGHVACTLLNDNRTSRRLLRCLLGACSPSFFVMYIYICIPKNARVIALGKGIAFSVLRATKTPPSLGRERVQRQGKAARRP